MGPTTPFVARISDRDGVLSGEIVEPNFIGRSSRHLAAFLHGHRAGSSVDFTKSYDGASDAAHAVDYSGRLSGDGTSIRGVWSLADWDGSFEMVRDGVEEEAVERQEEVELKLGSNG
jgi:hypothetical protein